MRDLTFAEVDELLRYEPETGKLFWRERGVEHFSSLENCKRWNRLYAGKEAFTSIGGAGYPHGSIHRKPYLAHRIIWLLHTGAWPTEQIDHVNGKQDDNRICNLRAVSHIENGRNQRRSSCNTSGVSGVHWSANRRKWTAQIVVAGRCIFLGRFDEFEDAVACRKTAEREHGFHPNHGSAA